MKKTIMTIAIAAALCGCSAAPADWSEASWNAFCDARGYDRADDSAKAYGQYLDTWRGSAEEEAALEAAGVQTPEDPEI